LATSSDATAIEPHSTAELIGPGPYPPELVLTYAQYLEGYRFRVWFADGFVRDIDMTDELDGPVFEALRDPKIFSALRYDSELESVVWPNGADLATEFLRWGPHKDDGTCECGH